MREVLPQAGGPSSQARVPLRGKHPAASSPNREPYKRAQTGRDLRLTSPDAPQCRYDTPHVAVRGHRHPFAPAFKQCSLSLELPVGRAEGPFFSRQRACRRQA
jgi:hypothetical protein